MMCHPPASWRLIEVSGSPRSPPWRHPRSGNRRRFLPRLHHPSVPRSARLLVNGTSGSVRKQEHILLVGAETQAASCGRHVAAGGLAVWSWSAQVALHVECQAIGDNGKLGNNPQFDQHNQSRLQPCTSCSSCKGFAHDMAGTPQQQPLRAWRAQSSFSISTRAFQFTQVMRVAQRMQHTGQSCSRVSNGHARRCP